MACARPAPPSRAPDAAHASRGADPDAPPQHRCDLLIEPDFARKTLSVRARIETDRPEAARTFEFGLSDGYTDVAVEVDGAPATFAREQGTIVVTMPQPTRRAALDFHLRGAFDRPLPNRDETRPVIDDESLFLLWSDRFYPIDFNDWSLFRTTVVLPERFKAIAPGRLVGAQRQGDAMRWVFETSDRVGPASVFADSRWVETQRKVNGIAMRTLLHPESAEYAEQIFSTSADVLAFYSELHGGYPFDGFAFVTVAGMNPRRAFPGFVAYEPRYLKKELTQTGHDAHETALLWWGYATHGRGRGSSAWTEGFGDYVEFLYDEARGKPRPAIFDRFRAEYLKKAPTEDRHYSDLGGAPQEMIHGKFPWIMQELRKELGDARFRDGIRLLFARYHGRTFSMDEFIATFEAAGGRSLRAWRDEWLERPPPRRRD